MLITDKGILGKNRGFLLPEKAKLQGKEQSKTNRRAVGLDTAFYCVYTFVYKKFVFY